MKLNMGRYDRVIRVLIAVLFTVLYLTNVVTGILGIVLVALAAIFLLTSLMGFCPLYWPFRITTKKE